MDKISIIVPIYNIMEYLPRCVQSLRAQTYQNLEILLVDDGSTDGTGELCEELAGEDERIRVFHKANGGSSSARNYGLARATGEFIGFVDSDDYVEPDMYERLHEAIVRYGVRAAQIGRDEITPEGERLPDICIPPKEPELVCTDKFMEELLMHRGDCSFCTKLISAKLFEDERNRFPEGVLNEDFHLLVLMLEEIGTIVSLPGYGYHVFYRVGSNSRKESSDIFSRVFADSVENADMAAKLVAEKYPQLSEISFRFGVFQRIEYLLHIPIKQMTADNEMYQKTVRFLRRNWLKAMKNPVLTKKNKLYHTLFAIAPKGIRKLHRLKLCCCRK
ncbi:MAG: glycosyltransferase family 2 protein [Acetatifactor sp.]